MFTGIFRIQNSRPSERAQAPLPSPSDFTPIDLIVHGLILILGALAFTFYLRVPNEMLDARYIELARSILEKGSYQFDFRPETMLPPGFPLVLAFVCLLAGYSHSVLLHVMAVSTTLALTASYEFLRRTESRGFAAAAVLLLGSSPAIFTFATQIVFSDMPYFCASIVVLLLAWLAFDLRPGLIRIGWMLAFSFFLIAALMIRSVGIALILGLCLWICSSFLADVTIGWRRLRLFLLPLLLASFTQVTWSHWAKERQFTEWPLPGYPASYLEQLKVKSGEYPELGMARWSDIPERVERNATIRTAELVKLLTRKPWINPYWGSPAIFGVIGLMFIGWASSIRKNGGQLHDWYFAAYELMFAFWPWDFEMRFLLPIVPLACLYGWRGALVIRDCFFSRRRFLGFSFAFAGVLLAASCSLWAIQTKVSQATLSAGFWILLAVAGWGMLNSSWWSAWQRANIGRHFLTTARVMTLLLVTLLVGKGVAAQVHIGRQNLTLDLTQSPFYPEIEAAQWIASHEPPQVVIMSRKQDLAYHYSNHRVAWFPPLSNPQILMDGILKYNVRVVVVADRDTDYFKPSQEDCFQPLYHAHPEVFHLVHHGPENWVYEVRLHEGLVAQHRD